MEPKSEAMVNNNIHTVRLAVRHSARSVQSSVGAGAAAGSGPAVLRAQSSTGVASFLWENREVCERKCGCWCVVNVQCLSGPLLGVPEMSRKAERIRLKDFSQRDVTSSDVIPFVSIFGRIFNLMVPAQVESET